MKKIYKKLNIDTKIFLALTLALFITSLLSIVIHFFSMISYYIFGMWTLYFLGWVIYNTGKKSSITFNKKEWIIIIIGSISLISLACYILFNSKRLLVWDSLIYYTGNLNLLNIFENKSFLDGIFKIISTTYCTNYSYFLLSFVTLFFGLTNRTQDMFIICYELTLAIPMVITFMMVIKKILQNINIKNKWFILFLSIILIVSFPLFHYSAIMSQPDFVGLIFVNCIILLTLDYNFDKVEWDRYFYLSINVVCLLMSRRWYMYWLLGYGISYILCFLYENIKLKNLKKFKIRLLNALKFLSICLGMTLLILTPMFIRILKQDFSAYSSWKTGGYLGEFKNQFLRLGLIYVIFIIMGLLFNLKNKKTQKIIILLILTYFISLFMFLKTQNMGNHQSLLLIPTYYYLIVLLFIYMVSIKKKFVQKLVITLTIFLIEINMFGSLTNNKYLFNNVIFTSVSLKPIVRKDFDNIGDMVSFIRKNTVDNDIVYVNAASDKYSAQTFSGYLFPDLSLSKIIVYESSIDSVHGFPVENIGKAKYIFTSSKRIESTGAKLGSIVPAINNALNNVSEINDKFELVQEFKMDDDIIFYAYKRIKMFDEMEANYWKNIFEAQTEKYPDLFGNRIDKFLKEVKNEKE